MNQPVNPSKAVGQQSQTRNVSSDHADGLVQPPRRPAKVQESKPVLPNRPMIGASVERQVSEIGDGDASEATKLSQLGKKITGRTNEDALHATMPPGSVDLRAAPIEAPARAEEGEDAIGRPERNLGQVDGPNLVANGAAKSKENHLAKDQEELVIVAGPLGASEIGTLSFSKRFKNFKEICSKDFFIPQPSVLQDLMHMQMTKVSRTLG